MPRRSTSVVGRLRQDDDPQRHRRFAVRRGAITTVIGPNGAGKSTVFKTVFGLLPACAAARVRFDGARRHELRRRAGMLDAGICYVPQGRNIFPELSVRHNLELGGVAAGAEIATCRPHRGGARPLSGAARARPTARPSTLSGGQQKQLEIARGLLLDPKLMLIDEPSIGLSPMMVQETFGILKEHARQGRVDPDDRAERQARRSRCPTTASCSSSARRASSTRRRTSCADPRIGQLFLGGSIEKPAAAA